MIYIYITNHKLWIANAGPQPMKEPTHEGLCTLLSHGS